VIPRAAEIAYGLYGAWRLAHLDPAGMRFFDRSLEGFWKSFFAAVLVAPGYALILVLDSAELKPSAGPLGIVVVQSLIYVIIWVAFPLVMFYLAQALGRDNEYQGFVVAYNWAQVIQLLLVMPASLVVASDWLPDPIAYLLNIGVLAAVLGYEWFIARTALALSASGAAGVVALSFVLGVIAKLFGLAMIQ
jgi:hypothetical protein